MAMNLSKFVTLDEALKQAFSCMAYADMTIDCADGMVMLHRSILAAASPFLRPILREYNGIETNRIIVPDVSTEIMKQVLCLMYTGSALSVDIEHLQEIVTAAELLGVELNNSWEIVNVLVLDAVNPNVEPEAPHVTAPVTAAVPKTEPATVLKTEPESSDEEVEVEVVEEVNKNAPKRKPEPEVPEAQKPVSPPQPTETVPEVAKPAPKKRARSKPPVSIETATAIGEMLESGQLQLTPGPALRLNGGQPIRVSAGQPIRVNNSGQQFRVPDGYGQAIRTNDDGKQQFIVGDGNGQAIRVNSGGQAIRINGEQQQQFMVADGNGQLIRVNSNAGQPIHTTGERQLRIADGNLQLIRSDDDQSFRRIVDTQIQPLGNNNGGQSMRISDGQGQQFRVGGGQPSRANSGQPVRANGGYGEQFRVANGQIFRTNEGQDSRANQGPDPPVGQCFIPNNGHGQSLMLNINSTGLVNVNGYPGTGTSNEVRVQPVPLARSTFQKIPYTKNGNSNYGYGDVEMDDEEYSPVSLQEIQEGYVVASQKDHAYANGNNGRGRGGRRRSVKLQVQRGRGRGRGGAEQEY